MPLTEPPIRLDGAVGGDVVAGNKTVIQQAGGDIVGRDKITYQAPPIGVAALRQLPSPPADFTGRAAELAELRAALRRQGAAISGLRGLGGVGKTALALVLANELAGEYPDAQLFVNLQGVTQPLAPAAVMTHVIRAYRPVEKLPDDPAQLAAAYRSVLAGQRALLLFDNALDAAQIKPLIPPPGCLLLLTSRHRFALPGLKAINLDSLPPADAQALLLKLAPRIGGHAGELANLCGCLPLALTLVGSALAEREDLEPATYGRRLAQARLKVLDEVEASLALSYDLLSPELQRLWCLLCVFPAGFYALAAAAVWLLEPGTAADHLSDLLRFSLLEFNKDTKRYRLHDLAREFARSRLSAAEQGGARQRHAQHYQAVLAFASDSYLKGDQGMLAALAVYDQERANILAAQDWAAAHSGDDDVVAQLVSDFANTGAPMLTLREPTPAWIGWLEAGLAAARRLQDRSAAGGHLSNLGGAYLQLGQPRRAIDYCEQAVVIARERDDRRAEANALGRLGVAYRSLGEPRRAIDYHERALVIDREIGDRRGEGADLIGLGNGCTALGDLPRAIEYYRQALEIARELGDQLSAAAVMGNLGAAYAALRDPRRAIEYYDQQLAVARLLGDRHAAGIARHGLGDAYSKLDQPVRAVNEFEQALAIMREQADRRAEGSVLVNLGRAYAGMGEARQAIDRYEQALVIAREVGDRQVEAITSWNMGLVYEALGEFDQAIALRQRLVDYEREIGHPDAAAHALLVAQLRERVAGGADHQAAKRRHRRKGRQSPQP